MKRCIPLLVFTIVAVLVPTAWAIELVPTNDDDPTPRPGNGTTHTMRNINRLFIAGETGGTPPGAAPYDYGRGIMHWDLTGVSGISGDAILRLTVVRDRAYDGTLDVYKIKAANAGWNEDDVDAQDLSHLGGVPWVGGELLSALNTLQVDGGTNGSGMANADDGFEGVTAGDLNPIASHTYIDLSGGDCVGCTFDITIPGQVVQEWINNPSGNAGIIFMDRNEEAFSNANVVVESYFVLASRNHADANLHPLLIFQVPEPSSLLLAGMGLAGLLLCLWRKKNRKAA